MEYPNIVLEDGSSIIHPLNICDQNWVDDMRVWPRTEAPQVVMYLVESKACDLKDMKAYRSLDSYNYLVSGWVGQILIYKVSEVLYFLKCNVTPSQSITKQPHTAWVCVKTTGEIMTAGCTCMAGYGRACSHAGSVMWKIDLANRLGLTGVTCTDRSAEWNRGTKRNIEPTLIRNISFKKPKLSVSESVTENELGAQVLNTYNIDQFYSHESMLEHISAKGLVKLLDTPNTILHSLREIQPNIPVSKPCPEIYQSESIHDHSNKSTLPNSCEPCWKFYVTYIKLNEAKRQSLQALTLKQSVGHSSLWKESRRLRLTASTSSKVPKKECTPPDNFLRTKLYKPFKGDVNTAYGNEMETIARERFQNVTDLRVALSGTVVSEEESWLSASPDGLVEEDSILEIKCPKPSTFNLKNVDLVRLDGEIVFNPKGSRGYYTQVQISLYCTKRSTCYFFVYLGNGNDIQVICEYDASFMDALLVKLKKFYFFHFLPKMEEDHKKGILNINKEYVRFISDK